MSETLHAYIARIATARNSWLAATTIASLATCACGATVPTHATAAHGTTASTAASATSTAGTVPVEYGQTAQHGIVYTDLGGAPQLLDAFLPAPSGKEVPPSQVPAVMLIHGGGFVSGNRTGMDNVAGYLATTGLAAFSIDYTLATPSVSGFPLQVQQVLAAIAFVRDNATRFHVDPAHVATFGTSAGATLAVLSAMVAPTWQPDATVQADVGWSGVYDFSSYLRGTAHIDVPSQTASGLQFLGCSSVSDPSCSSAAHAASAVSYVSAGSPPTLLATSDDFRPGCEIVDPAQSTALNAALSTAGAVVQLDVNHSCAHALQYFGIELPATVSFLHQHL